MLTIRTEVKMFFLFTVHGISLQNKGQQLTHSREEEYPPQQ